MANKKQTEATLSSEDQIPPKHKAKKLKAEESAPPGEEKKETPESHQADFLDIDHEVVENNLNGNEVEKVKLEIAKFGRADAAIQVLNQKYGSLKVEGLQDKEGYKIAKKAWGEVRGYRTDIEKKKKEIKAFYIRIGKAIDKEEERLIELITPLEENLYKAWKAIDEEKEAEDKRQEEAELQQLQERVTELMTLGLRMNSGYYQLGDTITIDVATLRTMSPENYSVFLGKCKLKAEEIKAEDDRLKNEKLIEEKKLQDEKDQLARDRQKLDEERQELQKMREEKAQMIRERRINQMAGIKMDYDPKHGTFTYYNGFNSVMADAQEIFSLDDEQFKEMLDRASLDVKQKINEWETHKITEEKKKDERKKKHEKIFDIMTAAGLAFTSQENYLFRNSEGVISIPLSELMEMSESDIKILAGKKSLEIDNLKERATLNEKIKKDQEETDRRESMSDAAVWGEMLSNLVRNLEIDPAFYKSKKYQTKAAKLHKELIEVIDRYKD